MKLRRRVHTHRMRRASTLRPGDAIRVPGDPECWVRVHAVEVGWYAHQPLGETRLVLAQNWGRNPKKAEITVPSPERLLTDRWHRGHKAADEDGYPLGSRF